MATCGNLELRFNQSAWYASTTHDGYRVYEAIPLLAEFLDSVRNPTKEQLETWFRSTSKELLPYNYSRDLIGGVPDEVIMDIPRKLVLHTGHEGYYGDVSEGFPARFENACTILKAKYVFEILEYIKPEMQRSLKCSRSE